MKKTVTFLALILTLYAAAFADIAIDDKNEKKPGKTIDTTLHIRLDRNSKEPRLIVPKNHLRQLRAELEALDDGGDTSAAAIDVTRTQTIVSGVLLSLAFIVGGVWFARSSRKQSRAAAILIIGGSVLAGGALASIVLANAGPPPETRGITTKIFSEPVRFAKFASGRIKLEVSTTEPNLLLIVPDTEDKPAE